MWEEARKALQGASSTARERPYRYTVRLFDRRLDSLGYSPQPVRVTLREGAAEPLGEARVTLSWAAADGTGELQTRPDARGVYRFCSAPAGVPLRLTLATARENTSVSGVTTAPGPPLQQDLVLRTLTATRAAGAPEGEGTVVAGRVVDAATGEPVSGAEVRIGARGRARTTDAEGRFQAVRLRGWGPSSPR